MLKLLSDSLVVHQHISAWTGQVNVSRVLARYQMRASSQIKILGLSNHPALKSVHSVASQARNKVASLTVESMFGALLPYELKDVLVDTMTRLQQLFSDRVALFLTQYDPLAFQQELEAELAKQNILLPSNALSDVIPSKQAMNTYFRFRFSLTPLRLTDILYFDTQAQRQELEYLVAGILSKWRASFKPIFLNIYQRAQSAGFVLLPRDFSTLLSHLNRLELYLQGIDVPLLQTIRQNLLTGNTLTALIDFYQLVEETDQDVLYAQIVAAL